MTMSRQQWQRLLPQLVHAQQHIPLYRDLWADAGIDVRDFRGAEDLARLPLLTRRHLRDAPLEARLDPRHSAARLREFTTSGSTGEPLQLRFDRGTLRRRQMRFLRALWQSGYRPGQKVMLISSRPSHSVKRVSRVASLARWHYVDLYAGEAQLLRTYQRIAPRVLYGPLSTLQTLASSLSRGGEYPRPRVVISTSEQLLPGVARQLGQVFSTTVTDFYGSTEIGLVAWKPARCSSYLTASSDLLLEFAASQNPQGFEHGFEQLILTDLAGGSMPLFRYETGDLVRRDSAQSGVPIAEFSGKQLDHLRMKDGTRIAPYAVDGALVDLPGLLRYQVVQQADLSLQLSIEARDGSVVEAALRALDQLCGGQLPIHARESSLSPGARLHKARPVTSLVRDLQ
jgi:phenylacetate-CoA ligase